MGCDYYKLKEAFCCCFGYFSISVVLLLTVPGVEAITQEGDEDGQKQDWECKKVEHLQT